MKNNINHNINTQKKTISSNANNLKTFKVQTLKKEVRKKLMTEAYYLIDNIRKERVHKPFYDFDTYHEKDSSTGQYIHWQFLPAMIKNVELSDIKETTICLLDQKWLVKKQDSNLVCLVQSCEFADTNSQERFDFSLTDEMANPDGTEDPDPPKVVFSNDERKKINESLVSLEVFNTVSEEKQEDLSKKFDFSKAFFDNGAYPTVRDYFNLSSTTFEALLNRLKITVADNELTRETEEYYCEEDKEGNKTYWMMKQSELMDLIQRTGMFKLGKNSNKNLEISSIKKQFEEIRSILAKENKYNPVRVLFENNFSGRSETKKTQTIEEIIDCFIINDGGDAEYKEACKSTIKKFLISCIAALFEPVFNSRLAPIFVGRQNFGKSSIGHKLFGAAIDNAFTTYKGFDPLIEQHLEMLFRMWVVELSEPDKVFKCRDRNDAYKSATNPEIRIKRKYENEITVYKRRSMHYMTANNIDMRDDENTRNPIIRIKSIELEKMDKILGLKHTGGGAVKVVEESRWFDFWYEIYCCYRRGESRELTQDELNVFSIYLNANNRKNNLIIMLEDLFGIDERFNYEKFLGETVNGARYQIANIRTVCEKLAENESTAGRTFVASDFQKHNADIDTFMKRYFPEVTPRSLKCPKTGRYIKGIKVPVMLSRKEQEALANQRMLNQGKEGKENIAHIHDANGKQAESCSTVLSEEMGARSDMLGSY